MSPAARTYWMLLQAQIYLIGIGAPEAEEQQLRRALDRAWQKLHAPSTEKESITR